MAESRKIGAFAPFEWMIALRYLRAKRQESFVSVISGFSLVGIALGVATLIIVMSVMNGFRHELLKSILGLNGHVTVQADGGRLPDFDAAAAAAARRAGRDARRPDGGWPGDGQPERGQFRRHRARLAHRRSQKPHHRFQDLVARRARRVSTAARM